MTGAAFQQVLSLDAFVGTAVRKRQAQVPAVAHDADRGVVGEEVWESFLCLCCADGRQRCQESVESTEELEWGHSPKLGQGKASG